MALNFGILQPVNIGGQFMAGQKQAQENQLAQQQASIREQEMGMRQQEMEMRQREATEKTEDRATKLAKAETRTKFLTDLSAKMQEGGHKLDRKTLSSMMNFGLQNNETSLVDLATKGLTALDEQEQFAGIMGGGAPAAIRPSVAPGAMGSGTFDPNAPAPVAPVNALAPVAPMAAPVNALAAAPAGPDVSTMRRKRDQLLAMGTTRSIAAANALDRDIALASKTSDTPEIATMKALGYPPTQAGYQAYRDAQRQERMLTPDEEAQRIRISAASRAKPADLKQVPVHAQKAIVGASTAINKIDNAIAALEGDTEEATGMKGYLPDMALNRMYPKGTEARAAVADIGSLVMHERSGAAVTASESPRLKPFIPLITDDKTTALKKLRRMRQIQADDAEALAGTYTPEQGFREFKTPSGTPAAPAAGGATGGWGKAEAESK